MARGRVNVGGGGLGTFFGNGSDGTIQNLNAITTAPNGGTVANLWDMNAGTVFTTGTLSSASDQVVLQIDFGKPQFLLTGGVYGAMVLYQSSISTGTARTIALQHSDDGANWTEITSTNTLTTTPGDKTPNGSTFPTNGKRFWRLVLKAGGSNCTVSIQGITLNWISTDTQTTKVWRILEPSTLNGGAVVKQYIDYLLPVGYEHTVQNPCQGLVIYSQNDIVVNGVIDMSQKAGLAPNGNAIPMLISKKAYKTAKTSSLLHFDNNITDDNGRVWTNNGGATFDATNKKFGTHAISFNGTSQWIDTPASDDLSFGSEDFTIDFRVRPTAFTSARYIYSTTDSTGSNNNESVAIRINGTGDVLVLAYGTDGNSYTITSTTILSLNTYYHIEVSRYDGVLYLRLNGNLESSVLMNVPIRRVVNKPTIGRRGEFAGSYFAGQIDEFRVVKGKAMYTANFTPPVAPYVYQATYIDEPKTLEKYFQLTNVLQTLRGGYGGNGGYGGGYSGSAGRQTSVGIGGAGRQNLGGFGGGGSGGSADTSSYTGGIGGSILNSEIGGGSLKSLVFALSTGYLRGANSVNGAGGGGAYAGVGGSGSSTANSGIANGGGSGGIGGQVSGNPLSTTDSQYAGGFLMLISKNDITNSGTIRANGGAGSNGSSGVGGSSGGGGGGGGAGGGVIAMFYGNLYSNTGTVQVNGGAGGTGGAGVTGGTIGEAGGTGTSGSVGLIHTQKL